MDARTAAVRIVDDILSRGRTLDDAMEAAFADVTLEGRDRAFARLLAATVLRGLGEIEAVLAQHMRKAPREGSARAVLLVGAAQLLFLDTPPHAAISLAVDQVRADPRTRHLTGLVNAVLRKVATEGPAQLAALGGPLLNIPAWMLARWQSTYGADAAAAIAQASLTEAALDLSVKSDPQGWAERLGGVALPTGTVRLAAKGAIEDLDGYSEGAWWVQDAAAHMPAMLLGAVSGLRVADLCAAPGGKTAELAAAGAMVTAVDVSEVRTQRLRANLNRLKLDADIVVANVETWQPNELFDAVLLDAPCSATGTIRRHPDILRVKTAGDIDRLAAAQSRLLAAAARMVRPGGLLVYCSCSLEPEEGCDQVERFLAADPGFVRREVTTDEVGGLAEVIAGNGDLRTLPCHLGDIRIPDAPSSTGGLPGLDGFYAARLQKLN